MIYSELDKATSLLACHFVDQGIRPEMLVPVCFEKSMYATIAMLAILRAGGAFITLDPSHPQGRLKFIVRKAKANLVVVSPTFAGLFDDIADSTIIVSEVALGSLSSSLDDRAPVDIKPYNAAFALFTSGSTGTPKGIVQEHSSVATSSLAHGKALKLSSKSRVLQYAAYTFDVSMMDIFTTLIFGGCVCVLSEDRKSNITGFMNAKQINWVLFTPSMASLISPSEVPSLETLVLGGEAVMQENISRWAGAVTLFNCYGPTECAATTVRQLHSHGSRLATIGRESSSAVCRVVDPTNHHRLLSIGAVGELLVEGLTLAGAHLDDMARAKAAFIKNPEWASYIGIAGARRFYKTGDLVRYNSDGSLDFVGWKDFQVKDRGQRVELGEFEHHLSLYPGIALLMVSSPETGAYAKSLGAVIQLHRGLLSSFDPPTQAISLVDNY